MNLPPWFTKGLVAYVSGPMDAMQASRLRDGILGDRFNRFNRLEGDDALLVGQAIWSYVADVYGASVIPNILYMTRVSRNAESGFLFVLGVPLKSLSKECLAYYKDKFQKDEQLREASALEELKVKYRKRWTYSQFKLSPNGRYAAWVSNELGQYKVWMRDLSEDRTWRIAKGEKKLNRIVDRSFPILAWHPGSKALSFAVERKGEVYLKTYTLDDRRTSTRPVFMLEKLLAMAYSPDGQNMVFSGVREGRSDLYLYYLIGNRQEQLTNDQFDDLDPNFTSDGSGSILFCSDRTDDTLLMQPANAEVALINGRKDVFRFDLASRSPYLQRLTHTPLVDEMAPAAYDSLTYTYLSDAAGLNDRYRVRYDSVVSQVDTTVHYRYFTSTERISRLRRSILEQDVHATRGRYAQLLFENGRYRFLMGLTTIAPLGDTGVPAIDEAPGHTDPQEGLSPVGRPRWSR
ncbi:MAG: PD40 domain-containing protein [Flavobacteriales bacterium]|nr:PD40 domain-containing protein [Flavobacteriales bacterium]